MQKKKKKRKTNRNKDNVERQCRKTIFLKLISAHTFRTHVFKQKRKPPRKKFRISLLIFFKPKSKAKKKKQDLIVFDCVFLTF